MTTDKVIYETGATSHAVNDLILFTNNTRELAELRDAKYFFINHMGYKKVLPLHFWELIVAAKRQYVKEMPQSCSHIKNMSHDELREYCKLYVNGFENWKQEHNNQVS